MDELLGQLVSTTRSERWRRLLRVTIPISTFLCNPVVRASLFYLVVVHFFNVPAIPFFSDHSNNSESSSLSSGSDFHTEGRLSDISYWKAVQYGVMGYATMAFHRLITPGMACLLYFFVPYTWFLVYYIVVNRIYFTDPILNTMYAILLIISCYQIRYHCIHLYKTMDQVERERRNMNNIELIITALGNHRITRVANNISRMNFSQLKKYKEYLENELTKVTSVCFGRYNLI